VAAFGVQLGQKLVLVLKAANFSHACQIGYANNAAVFVVKV